MNIAKYLIKKFKCFQESYNPDGFIFIFLCQTHRESLIHVRKPLALIQPWMFFILVIFLFPFILSQETKELHKLMPGLIWIAALLSYLLSIERFFEMDHENGSLESLLIYPYPLTLSIFAKTITHWFLTGFPLTVLSLPLGYFIGLSSEETRILMVSLLLGTPTLSCLGTILGAITISLASRGLLLAILLIPLSIPILIFGTGSVLAVTMEISHIPSLSFLAAILITALLGTPFASAAALRLN